MSNKLRRKPKPEYKPDSVKIKSNLTVISQQTEGGMALTVLAVGDDDVVYSWEGAAKKWMIQR